MTTQAKLNRLIETKNAIRQKLISLGIDVPMDTPFEDYAEFMKQLGGAEFIETTTDQELLQLLDLYMWLSTYEYEDYTYPDIEVRAVHDLLDKINNGPVKKSDVVVGEPKFIIVARGKTDYYADEVFDFNSFSFRIVYENGPVVNPMNICTFSPNTPLTTDDTNVTVNCEYDGHTFTLEIPIIVTVFVPSLVVTRAVLDQGTFKNVTPTYLTNQVDGSDGFTIVGRNSSSSSSAKHSGNLRWTISLDLSGWDSISFYAKKNANHGMIRVGIEDNGTIVETLLSVHYNDGPTSWTKYIVDISKYDGVHTVFFVGGYTDSTGNTSSSTSYCNIIFS